MTPAEVLRAVEAVANAVSEVARYLQTPAGQEDRKWARDNEKEIKQWFADLFSGKLLK